MILIQKVGNLRLISGKNLFFFKDHYDFGVKSEVFCLFGPPMGQNGPRLKKVGHPCTSQPLLELDPSVCACAPLFESLRA